jgi:AraC-like DNA-binding protein
MDESPILEKSVIPDAEIAVAAIPWYHTRMAYLFYLLSALSALAIYLWMLWKFTFQKRLMKRLLAENSSYERQLRLSSLASELSAPANEEKPATSHIYVSELGSLSADIVCRTPGQVHFVHGLLRIIEANIDSDRLGTKLIADHLGMSQRQFYRKFREVSSGTPGDLIKNYRMEKAARLLADRSVPIRMVIAEVGISSRAYFYKEFAHRFGMTPGEFRTRRE